MDQILNDADDLLLRVKHQTRMNPNHQQCLKAFCDAAELVKWLKDSLKGRT